MKRKLSALLALDLSVFALMALVVCLPACKNLTPIEQAGAAIITNTAVGNVVRKGTNDPAVWAERAGKIVTIAQEVEALGTDQVATVPEVLAALTPIMAKAHLAPDEQATADILVTELVAVANQQKDAASIKATIHLILSDVIASAQLYVPVSSSP